MGEKTKPKFTKAEFPILGTRWMNTGVIHKFDLPAGKSGQWESIKGNDEPTVLLCGLTKEGHVITINLFRFPVDEFCTELPGGTVEIGEASDVAILREFVEETGHKPQRVQPLCEGFLWNGKSNQRFKIWVGFDCEKVQDIQLDPVEKFAQLTVIPLSVSEIQKRIAGGDVTIDPPISHAILAMQVQELI